MGIQLLILLLLGWFLASSLCGRQIEAEATSQEATSTQADQAPSANASAQTKATPAAPQSLPNPLMTAPLQTAVPPHTYHGFFVRGEFSFVQARSFTAGDAFGPFGQNGTQTRGVVEAGFLF